MLFGTHDQHCKAQHLATIIISVRVVGAVSSSVVTCTNEFFDIISTLYYYYNIPTTRIDTVYIQCYRSLQCLRLHSHETHANTCEIRRRFIELLNQHAADVITSIVI